MNENLEKAKKLLKENNYTCVIICNENIYTTTLRGIKPLAQWYDGGTDFQGAYAADKVVGKGAAFIYILLGVNALYADVISQSALQLLNASGIYVEYNALVKNIINRKGDGICPFEEAVLGISDKTEAYYAIKSKMEDLL